MTFRKKLLIGSLLSISAVAFAEPNIYGNINFNANSQNNYNLSKDTYYLNITDSFVGFRDKIAAGQSPFIMNTSYQLELGLNLEEENPIFIKEAFVALGTSIADVSLGQQQDVVYDILAKPMDIFYGADIIASTSSEFVTEEARSSLRVDSRIGNFYIGGSVTMDDNDPDSDTFDSYSLGFANKGRNYQYGAAYWTDNDWVNSESLSYWGTNVSYNGKIWGTSVSYVYSQREDVSETFDSTLTVKYSSNLFLKARYSNLSDQWNAYGFGLNGQLNKNTLYYIEHQNRTFKDESIAQQSVITGGINIKL